MLKLPGLLSILLFRDNFASVLRKWTIAFLAVLYLGLSSGFMVSWHYCMGELSSVDIGHATTDICGKCGMKDQSGCCETHSKLVKVQDEHQSVKVSAAPAYIAEAVIHDCLLPLKRNATGILNTSLQKGSPPGLNGLSRHLFLSVFQI